MSSDNQEISSKTNDGLTNGQTTDDNIETYVKSDSNDFNEKFKSKSNNLIKNDSNNTIDDIINEQLTVNNGVSGDNRSDEQVSNQVLNENSGNNVDIDLEEEMATKKPIDLFVDSLGFVKSDEFPSLEPLPDTVTELDGPNGSKVYLIGTAHFSEKSQQDVSRTIRRVQPNIVVLELCESRLSILSFDEKSIMEESKTMGIAKMRRNIQEFGVVQGVMYILLLSLSAHLTKELGMAPGGEFRRAFKEANQVPGCVVHLGDRPVHITLRRAISSLSVWQKIRLAFGIIFNNETISKEEVEKCKQKDLLEEMLAEMTGEFPALSRVFVNERDTYLAYSLWLASSPIPDMSSPKGIRPAVVVGVVGIGHVPGIVKQWGKVSDKDIPPLLQIPETSLTTKLIKKSVKYTFLGLAVWGCYKLLVPNSLNAALSDASLHTIEWIQTKIRH